MFVRRPVAAPGGLQDRVEQEGGRGLPVRPRDRRNLERAGGVVEEEARGDRHRGARIGDDELWQLDGNRVLDDERSGPELGGRGRQVVPVRGPAAHAEEERSRRDGPRVVREVANLDRGRPARRAVHDLARPERHDEALQVHRAPSLPPRPVLTAQVPPWRKRGQVLPQPCNEAATKVRQRHT